MRTLKMALLVFMIIGCLDNDTKAQDHGVNGLLLGAGGGALVGQAVGRDTEGTLIGTAVGGMLGYMVGNEMDKDGYGQVYASPQPVFYPTPTPTRRIYHPPPPPPPRYFPYHPDYGRRHHGYSHGPDRICRETVVVSRYHGRYRETLKTVCRDRDDWRYDRHHYGPPRRDRYGWYDRW